jgi:hypothetical protein
VSIKGQGAWKGKHWMQQPENREKVMAMHRKMQKGARRARRAGKYRSKAHKIVAKAARRAVVKPKMGREADQDTVLVLNGWKIVLGHNSIKIEQG